jgi:DNA mismatch repair protein MSH5
MFLSLFCFASATEMYDYRRPFITEDNVIKIQKGRHPLQELVVDAYVPNSTILHGGYGLIDALMDEDEHEHEHQTDSSVPVGISQSSKKSVMVITGSNASGKSVYGKAVALIVYMSVHPLHTYSIGDEESLVVMLNNSSVTGSGL